MTERDLLDLVRRRAGLETRAGAEAATLAVLRLLVGRLSWREQLDLASVLPPRLARAVRTAPNSGGLRYAPPQAFFRDLDDELLVGPRRVVEIARAVAATVAELLPSAEMRDLRGELNATFDALFAAPA